MDEMMISTNEITGETNFYYKRHGVVVPESWKKLARQNWPKQVMVAMGICWNGTSRIYIVPEETKINASNFIQLILKPMVKKDIPRLYGKEAKDVIFHMDSAPGHVATDTVQWLQQEKVKYISKEEWLANSPDLAQMDFSINSIFKKIVKKRSVNSATQLARMIRAEWKKFTVGIIRKRLLSWKKRIDLMTEKQGYQIEHDL